MTSGAIPPLVCALLALFLGVFVLTKNVKSWVNRSFALLCFETFHWQAAWFFSFFIHNEFGKDLIVRIAYTLLLFLPFTYYHFVTLVLDYWGKEKNFVISMYIVGLFFLFLTWTGNGFVAGYNQFEWGYYGKVGLLHRLYLAFFLMAILRIYFLIRKKKRSQGLSETTKAHIRFIFFAYILFLAAGIEFLVNYGVNFYPFGVFFILGSFGVTSYAITRYHLLDIDVLIKRTLVFAGLFGMVMITATVVTALTQKLIARFIPIGNTFSLLFSGFVIILLYEPTRKLLINTTDRFLFQKKQEVNVILNHLSENIVTILDIEKVGETVLSTLRDLLRLESGTILIQDEDEKNYRVLDAFGVQDKSARFESGAVFIQYLAETGKILNVETPEAKLKFPSEVISVFQNFNAVIAMPLFFQKELTGVLFLGKKKSDQEFSSEDMDYFPTLAGQVALAVRNARLHDIIMKSQIDFAQQAKMAAIGTLAAGIGHEVKNPLNNIRGAVGMLKLNKKHHFYDDKPPEEVFSEFFEALDIVEKNVDRAAKIIDRLQSFAKKPKELRSEKVNLAEALDSALAFVSSQLELQEIKIVKHYTSQYPFVLADRGALEDAMLNLITNAAHAMQGKGTLTLAVAVHDSEVQAAIQDTGAGIAPETLEKIFDPFFTTKDTTRNTDAKSIKGTGLGLFIVREVIKRFGGRIAVESRVNIGTTFRIFFPVYQEKGANAA